ncbi:sigma-70 family RNA polymerase sigma factor [Candidatus Peregrinibacteria bacterium]|nr:MAG: sigma-70 family RNA polymerase sigma factor [Candidatus Peregrinibacteria bacterium]
MTKFPDSLTDEQLAIVAQQDIDAFGKIVDRYEKPLLRYIRRLSDMPPEEAEEVLQEVFLKAWKYLNDFDSSQKFSSWIYRITHNETIAEYRRKKSRGSYSAVEWDDELFANLPNNMNVQRDLDRHIDAKNIRQAILHLPENYRNAIILRYLEEKSYDEIADILRVPMGTVATLVNRAKKMLRNQLRPNGEQVSATDYFFSEP